MVQRSSTRRANWIGASIDDGALDLPASPSSPKVSASREQIDGSADASGRWPLPVDDGAPPSCPLPTCARTTPVSLDYYPGSEQPPSCHVDLDAYVRDAVGKFSGPAQAELYRDGSLVGSMLGSAGSSPVEVWPVPYRLGRVEVGTRLDLKVWSFSGDGEPHANLRVDDGKAGLTVYESCSEPGCTADAGLVVEGYCAD